jgi:hypothetical protein
LLREKELLPLASSSARIEHIPHLILTPKIISLPAILMPYRTK